MKRLLAIFFLFSFLNANTAFGQILKLPVLLQHYIEHTQEDEETSLFRFLVQHYTDNVNHQHQNSNTQHEKLPFKTADGHLTSVISIVSPSAISFINDPFILPDLKNPVSNQSNCSNMYLNNIWQPPRFN